MATISLRDEATKLLQELLRLDTVNPPGNERQAAELLRSYLEPAGVECRLLARAPERANFVARLPGRGDGPSLLLLCHTDTVVADPREWSVDPWSGALADGHVWGRGALDMKGHVAAAAVAVAALAREGFEPSGDLLLAATADEEVGAGYGLSWLCEEHPDAVRADYCVNEGGGDRIVSAGQVIYLCSTAEKASSPFRLAVRGRSGHASTPGVADNALVRAGRLLARLDGPLDEPRILTETAGFLEAALGEVPPAAEVRARLAAADPDLAVMAEPMLALTVSPTMIEASSRRNVIPGTCEIVCDCRLLPGQTQAEAEEVVRRRLGEDLYELEWLECVGGSRSEIDGVLWPAIEEFVAAEEPGARLAPVILSGFTDSHYLREAFGTLAYGFLPMRAMEPALASRLIHSADERMAIADLELGTRFLVHAARTLLA